MTPDLHAHFINQAHKISPDLAAHIKAVGPVRLPRNNMPDLVVFLARTVVDQQLSVKAANTIWARIEAAAEKAGRGLSEFFEEQNIERLRACGTSGNKAKALGHIHAAHKAGQLDPKKIRKMNHASRSDHLNQIWGIGQWTSDMASIFYCRDPDVWSTGDIALRNTLKRYCGRKKPENAAKLFAPHRSLFALYIWRIVDGKSGV